MRWSPAPPDGLRQRLRLCRWDTCCRPVPGCATRRDEASRSRPPCWLCAPLHRPPGARLGGGGRRAGGPARQAGPSARPELHGQLGIGSVVAGQLITSSSHHRRIRSEAAFAKLGGAAPIEASSGTGTRQVWRSQPALPQIVLVRVRQDSATKEYVQRRLAQGKTIRDIKRCLKRYMPANLRRCPRPLDETWKRPIRS
jgi:Transposase IS116/IS110/IS902 family